MASPDSTNKRSDSVQHSSKTSLPSIPPESFFDSPSLSDVTVCFGIHTLHAHKITLAQGSSYFRRAFLDNVKVVFLLDAKIPIG